MDGEELDMIFTNKCAVGIFFFSFLRVQLEAKCLLSACQVPTCAKAAIPTINPHMPSSQWVLFPKEDLQAPWQ